MVLDDVLNEAYLGKTKELKHMEDLIDKIRKKYGDKGNLHSLNQLFNTTENSKEWQDLRKAFEDTFGFYSVSLMLDTSSELPNASTFPVNIALDANVRAPFAVSVKGRGIKYDKKQKFCTIIYVGAPLLFSKTLTSAEILAVLLHEVGHNFDTAVLPGFMGIPIIRTLYIVSQADLNQLPVLFLYLTSSGRYINNRINNIIQSDKGLLRIRNMMTLFIYRISYFESIVDKFLYPIIKVKNLRNIISAIFITPVIVARLVLEANVFTYHSETFADSFATLLGYGPELQSALVKLDDVTDEGVGIDDFIKQVPLVGHFLGVNEFIWDHIASMIDGHPNKNARIKTSISLLEKDLEDPRIDKKTKYQVQSDLKKLNKIYDEFNRLEDTDDIDYTQDARAAMERLTEFIYGRHTPDIRSGLMDIFYGGASSIHKSIERLKRNK